MKTNLCLCLLMCSSLIASSQTNFSGPDRVIISQPGEVISNQTNTVSVVTNSSSAGTLVVGSNATVGLGSNLFVGTNLVTTNSVSTATNSITEIYISPCSQAFPSNYSDHGDILAGFGTNFLRGSYDNTSRPTELPFAINFYNGGPYSLVWINEDGNVTLDAPFSGHSTPSYVPSQALSKVNHAIFAPFWADLDTTTNGSGVVSYGTGCAFAGGRGWPAFGVTWSNVSYYKGHQDKANTFQMLLIERPDLGSNAFDLQYRYRGIQWDTADSAAGAGGLCMVLGGVQNGYPARVGFANTNNYFSWAVELPGSGTAGALLDNGTNSLTANSTNSNNAKGVYTWHFVNGFPQ